MTYDEYYAVHTQNLRPTKYWIDPASFALQASFFPFQKWGDTHTEFERWACPLVNQTGTFQTPDAACAPLDRINFLKKYPQYEGEVWTDAHKFDWDLFFKETKPDDMILEDSFQMKTPALSMTSLDPIDELKPFMLRSCILLWHYGGHFKKHIDNWTPSQWIRLWGTTKPSGMVLRYEEKDGQGEVMVEEKNIEAGRLYLHDSIKPHEALAYQDDVYQFFIAMDSKCLEKIRACFSFHAGW